MTSNAEHLLSQLHKLLSDLEGLAKSAADTAGQEGEEAAGRLKETLASARTRIRDAEHELQRNVARGARAADDYVHQNAWVSVGVAAAVGFLLGALTSHRDR